MTPIPVSIADSARLAARGCSVLLRKISGLAQLPWNLEASWEKIPLMPSAGTQLHRGSYVSLGLMISIVVGAGWALMQINGLRNEFSPQLASMKTALVSISENISKIEGRMSNAVTHEELKLYLDAKVAPLEARVRMLEGR